MATWLVALPCFSLSLFLAFCCRVVVAFGLCNESLSSPERATASAPRHQQLDIYIYCRKGPTRLSSPLSFLYIADIYQIIQDEISLSNKRSQSIRARAAFVKDG